eukprot:386077_1
MPNPASYHFASIYSNSLHIIMLLNSLNETMIQSISLPFTNDHQWIGDTVPVPSVDTYASDNCDSAVQVDDELYLINVHVKTYDISSWHTLSINLNSFTISHVDAPSLSGDYCTVYNPINNIIYVLASKGNVNQLLRFSISTMSWIDRGANT